ncbi:MULTISPECIES: heavy metal translocating P-type ATPase [Brucella/Ochrobactrum group]|uniref:P-type Zn(2+) transporter n=1 Tax=Ochrobactrum chromiisoli TaxID=2993941 RepID=A0ABT3QT90_9HYPH|nr:MULTISPECIES: cation-translocating P-type ATPase [Brucella/Ochrobactrum group]KAB2692947.1 cation-translocating P-type ATPase [Ochrobactrum sp. Kaboul]MCX2698735.1 cation-translocating P-type ATPase [Ochrobactrum chromiisoli]
MAVHDTTHPRRLADEPHGHAAEPHPHAHHHHDHEHDDHEHGHDHDHPFEWPEAVRIALVAVAAAAVWFQIWEPFQAVSVIGVAGLLIGGWPILKEAFENIVERRMTMELSMTIAIAAAAAIGEFFTALVITLFVLVAEVLEGLTVGRGRKAIRDLLEFLPREVSVRRAGAIRSVSAEELSVGDAILVAPGGRIPVDGAVLSGHSFVDESRITGESMPVEKVAGTHVFAGSINQSGALEVSAERIGRDTSYGKIIEAVERAEKSRAPVQRLADRLAGYLVYFALGAAVLTFLLTRDIYSTISVIIVAGACGIAAGTPLAILGGIGRSARLGAIVKGGVHLETLGQVDTVVLDKTGTLTFGRPEVQQVVPVAGRTEEELLDAAATAELRSEHPLGKAILAYVRQQGREIAEPGSFGYTPGRGITAKVDDAVILVGNRAWMADNGIGNVGEANTPSHASGGAGTEILVARDGILLGSIVVADTVRPEARNAIASLQRMGIRTILLTGDAERVASAVGGALGIREIEAELLPEDKLKRIDALVAQKRVVAMVGDGVNDAPALAQANVGVAMGSGTDVAQESADVVLLGNDLERFVETLAVARRTRGIIWQNFAGTIGVDTLGIVLAAFGFLNPLLAAAIHVVSELVFILNSARLLPARANEGADNAKVASETMMAAEGR